MRIIKFYRKVNLVAALFLAMTGCGKDWVLPKADVPTETPSEDVPAAVLVSIQDNGIAPSESTVAVTVFSKTKILAPMTAWPTKKYTATGYCLVYTGKTYCWDDGKKTLSWTTSSNSYGPYYYSYFNMSKNTVGYSHSNGGMQADLMTSPTVIAVGSGLATNLAAGAVTEVLSSSSVSVNCLPQENGNLNCGTFTVDVNQVPL